MGSRDIQTENKWATGSLSKANIRWDSHPLVIPLISALKSPVLQSRSTWVFPRNAAGKQEGWGETSCPRHLSCPPQEMKQNWKGSLDLRWEVNENQTWWCWGQGRRRAMIKYWIMVQTGKSSVVTQHPPNPANPQRSCSNSNNCNKKQLQLCPLFCHSCDKIVSDSISHWRGKQQPASPLLTGEFYQLQETNRTYS